MPPEDFLNLYAKRLAQARTRAELRQILNEVNEALDEARYQRFEKRAFFGELLQEAQDNSATMSNSGEAQEIVNQILNESR